MPLLPTLRLIATIAVFSTLIACPGDQTTPPATSLPTAIGTTSSRDVSALKPGDRNLCDLVPRKQIEQRIGRPVTRTLAFRSIFIVPGMRKVGATQCRYEIPSGTHLAAVNIRITSELAREIFEALSRIDSAALQRIDAPPPGVEAFWQSVGRTIWLRNASTVIAVELVTDAELPEDLGIARSIAVAALRSAA